MVGFPKDGHKWLLLLNKHFVAYHGSIYAAHIINLCKKFPYHQKDVLSHCEWVYMFTQKFLACQKVH